ncbi:MAG TPA: hypothetical protein VMB26_09835 [Candidatus Binataceae bacterium]|nr:hypothetical protein [Candidatus Binataceae bacterium]
MARRDAEDLMTKLLQMSEEGLAAFFGEAIKNDGMRRALGRAGERFLANKSRFDRNVETLLDFVSIPSKRDIRELKARLDHLNGQVVNLSMKLDRMLAQVEKPAARRSKKRGGADEAS